MAASFCARSLASLACINKNIIQDRSPDQKQVLEREGGYLGFLKLLGQTGVLLLQVQVHGLYFQDQPLSRHKSGVIHDIRIPLRRATHDQISTKKKTGGGAGRVEEGGAAGGGGG